MRTKRRNDAQIAKSFQTQDGHETPKTSPLTIGATEIAITIPSNAVAFVYWVENYSIRVSEITGMARYNKVLAGGSDVLECADLDSIYVKRDGSNDATLHFYFRTI